MTEPLFLQSVFQEKIWGGDHLKSFGYDLPTDKIGEYWAISAHPNGLSTIKMVNFPVKPLDVLYKNHRDLFGNSQKKCFHS